VIERVAKVVVIGVETFEPLSLVDSPQLRFRFLGNGEETVCVACRDHISVRAVCKHVGGKGTKWLEHRVAGAGTLRRVRDDKRLFHEPGQHVEHVTSIEPVVGTDDLGIADQEASGEHREPLEEPAFLIIEKVVAPPHSGIESGVPHRLEPGTPFKQREVLPKSVLDVGQAQDVHPRCSELDRQWQPIEAPAYRNDVRPVRLAQLEVRVDETGSLDEQVDGFVLTGDGRARTVTGERQWRHRPRRFTLDPEALPARCKNGETRTACKQRTGKRCRRLEKMFTVVEDEEKRPMLEIPRDEIDGWEVRLLRHAERLSDRERHLLVVPDRREIDEPDTVGVRGQHPLTDLAGQPGLSCTTRTGESDERARSNEFDETLDLSPSPNKARHRTLEVGSRRGAIRLAGQRRVLEEDPLLEVVELGTGLDAEFLSEDVGNTPVGPQRIALAPTAVQGKHQAGPGALGQRIFLDELLELGDHLEMVPERQLCVDECAEHMATELLEARHLCMHPFEVAYIGKDITPPQVQSSPKRLGRRPRRACQKRLSATPSKLLEPGRIDRLLVDIQSVPIRNRDDFGRRVPVDDRAKSGDIRLEGGPRGSGRLAVPEPIDEAVTRNSGIGVEEQQRKEVTLTRAGRDDALGLGHDVDRSEHQKLQVLAHRTPFHRQSYRNAFTLLCHATYLGTHHFGDALAHRQTLERTQRDGSARRASLDGDGNPDEKMEYRMKKLALIMTLSLVIAACGGADNAANSIAEKVVEQASGNNVDISSDDGGLTMSVEGDDGIDTVSFNEDLPEGFPFPVPDTYEVGGAFTYEGDAGTSYSVVIQVSADQFDAMEEMYQSWMESEGFTVDTTELGDDTSKVALIEGERDDVSAGASLSLEAVSNDDAGNVTYATVITLSWDAKA